MRTESEDCSKLRQPENRQRQEPNEAKTQKTQEEPAAAYVTPGMREQHFYEIKSQKAISYEAPVLFPILSPREMKTATTLHSFPSF